MIFISVPASSTYTERERKLRTEPLCSATLQSLSVGSPSLPPDDPLDYIPSNRCPSFSEFITLATKGRQHTTDDDTVLFIYPSHKDSMRRACTPPPPLLSPSTRV